MADIKRYSMTMEFYIYADSDKNAVDLAEHIVEKQKKKWDNRAWVSSVKEQPFGSLLEGAELIAK